MMMTGEQPHPNTLSQPSSGLANPYIGLRPYQENERTLFFGRDNDRKIFVDMVLANRLTLLFAASGVGKSSLLQAAVLPQLKNPAQENLDAVYCNNWAVDHPMQSIRDATLQALGSRGRIDAVAMRAELGTEPLHRFFELCSHFVRHPLVIILDQFEEFFHYHQGSGAFTEYRNQLVELITDRMIPISLVISMREDFALALNAFKPELPTVLFNNYYRLEKLPRQAAEVAIVQPAAHVGFTYEPELLQILLTDLAARDHNARPGTPVAEMAFHVEPPYLQIVCSQLFALDCNDPEKKLRLATYRAQDGARGLLSSYIDRVTAALSYPERQLASKCFSHLITRRGTKVAHTAESLAKELRVSPTQLEAVLKRLERARLLRSQSQDQRTWYELYHDLFSDSVEQWNERFKAKERLRKSILGMGAFLALAFAVYAAYNAGINARNHHLRLSIKAGPTGQVELYRGQAETADLFRLQRYVAETGIVRQQIEPDQLFSQKTIRNLKNFDSEWSERLPTMERVRFFREGGNIAAAVQVADGLLNSKNNARVILGIQALTELTTPQGYVLLANAVKGRQNQALSRAIFNHFSCRKRYRSHTDEDGNRSFVEINYSEVFEKLRSRAMEDFLFEYINDINNPQLGDAARCLGNLGALRSIPRLESLLQAELSEDRASAVEALLTLDPVDGKRRLLDLLPKQREEVQIQIIDLLTKRIKNESLIELLPLLQAAPAALRISALKVLKKKWPNTAVVEPFLDDPDISVAIEAATSLSYPGNSVALQKIRRLKAGVKDSKLTRRLEESIHRLDPSLPDAERQFANNLIESFEREDSFLCDEGGVRFLALDASDRVLGWALEAAKPPVQRNILRCLPDAMAVKRLGNFSSLPVSVDPNLSGIVAKRLLNLLPTQGWAMLQKMIQSDAYDRQRAAINVLVAAQTERAYEMLSSLIIRRSASIGIRLSALRAMGEDSGPGVAEGPWRAAIVARLRQTVHERDSTDFRLLVAAALTRWAGEAAIPDLLMLLSDSEKAVRKEAATQLRVLYSPRAAAELQRAKSRSELLRTDDDAEDNLPHAQSELVNRLKSLLRSGGGSARDEWHTDVRRILYRLASMAKNSDFSWAQPALDSSDREVRRMVVRAWNSEARDTFREPLKKLLASSDEDLRQAAVWGFVKLARARDMDDLQDHFRQHAQDIKGRRRSIEEIGLSFIVDIPNDDRWWDDSTYFGQDRSAKLTFSQADFSAQSWRKLAFPELNQRESGSDSAQRRWTRDINKILNSYDSQKRRDAIAVLRSINRLDSTRRLLSALDDEDVEVSASAAEALAARKEQTAIQPILNRATRVGQRRWEDGRLWAALRSLDTMRFAAQQRKWWPLLAAGCHQPYLKQFTDISYLTTDQRASMASLLVESEQPCSAQLLIPLSRDSAVSVRLAAAQALGSTKVPSVIPELHRLLHEADTDVQRAAAESLSKIATVDSIGVIEKQIMNPETPLRVIVPLLYALSHIGTPEAAAVLVAAAERYEDTVGWHAYRLLGDMRAKQILPRLWHRLKWQEAETEKWRAYRDRATNDRSDPQDEASQGQQRPDSFAMFELVTTIARLDDPETVIPLLRDNLSDVREAAALGLAVRGQPEIVARLDVLRADSQDPFFRRATFRAIDMSLDVIQWVGNAVELQQCKSLRDRIRDRDGVLSRLDWTINELEASTYEQARPAAAKN